MKKVEDKFREWLGDFFPFHSTYTQRDEITKYLALFRLHSKVRKCKPPIRIQTLILSKRMVCFVHSVPSVTRMLPGTLTELNKHLLNKKNKYVLHEAID